MFNFQHWKDDSSTLKINRKQTYPQQLRMPKVRNCECKMIVEMFTIFIKW